MLARKKFLANMGTRHYVFFTLSKHRSKSGISVRFWITRVGRDVELELPACLWDRNRSSVEIANLFSWSPDIGENEYNELIRSSFLIPDVFVYAACFCVSCYGNEPAAAHQCTFCLCAKKWIMQKKKELFQAAWIWVRVFQGYIMTLTVKTRV